MEKYPGSKKTRASSLAIRRGKDVFQHIFMCFAWIFGRDPAKVERARAWKCVHCTLPRRNDIGGGWERAASAHGDTRVAIMSGPTSTCRPSSDAYLHRIHTWTFHVNTVVPRLKCERPAARDACTRPRVPASSIGSWIPENFPGDRDSSRVNFDCRVVGKSDS